MHYCTYTASSIVHCLYLFTLTRMRRCHVNSVYHRSRFGLHSLSSCCDHDAVFPSVGLLLLHYDCVSGIRQPSENNLRTALVHEHIMRTRVIDRMCTDYVKQICFL